MRNPEWLIAEKANEGETNTGIIISNVPNSNVFSYSQLIKNILITSGYVFASGIISTGGSFINGLLISRIGTEALAASNLIFTTQLFTTAVASSLLLSTTSMISQSYTAGRNEEIGSILQQGWLISGIVSIPLGLVLWESKPILLLFKQPENLVDITSSYLKYYVWSLPVTMGLMVNSQFLMGTQRLKHSIIQQLIDSIGMNLLGACLGFGWAKFTPLGIRGIALGMSIEQWLSAIGWFAYFKIRENEFGLYKIFKLRIRNTLAILKEIICIGLPISIDMIGISLWLQFMTVMAGWLSFEALAEQQICQQYITLLSSTPILSLSAATTILVGHAYGQSQRENIRRISLTSMFIGIIYSFAILAVLLIFSQRLTKLFISEEDNSSTANIISTVNIMFIIMAAGQVFDSIRNVFAGTMRGLLETKLPMIASLLSVWAIAMPLSLYFGFKLNWGIVGITFANCIFMMINAFIHVGMWSYINKRIHQGLPGNIDLTENISTFASNCLQKLKSCANQENSISQDYEQPQDKTPLLLSFQDEKASSTSNFFARIYKQGSNYLQKTSFWSANTNSFASEQGPPTSKTTREIIIAPSKEIIITP